MYMSLLTRKKRHTPNNTDNRPKGLPAWGRRHTFTHSTDGKSVNHFPAVKDMNTHRRHGQRPPPAHNKFTTKLCQKTPPHQPRYRPRPRLFCKLRDPSLAKARRPAHQHHTTKRRKIYLKSQGGLQTPRIIRLLNPINATQNAQMHDQQQLPRALLREPSPVRTPDQYRKRRRGCSKKPKALRTARRSTVRFLPRHQC